MTTDRPIQTPACNSEARKRLNAASAYEWPDPTVTLAAQLATARAQLTQIRALVLSLTETTADDDMCLTERLIRLQVAGDIEAALHLKGAADV